MADRDSPLRAALLATVPVGLFIVSLLADLGALWVPGAGLLAPLSFYAMAGGFVGSLALLMPRIVDWTSEDCRATRRLARVHASVTGGAVALYALNLWMRQHGMPATGTPLWLSIAGVTLLALSTSVDTELVVRASGGTLERIRR